MSPVRQQAEHVSGSEPSQQSHPFARSTGLVQIVRPTIHDLIEEEARLWDEFTTDDGNQSRVASGRVSPGSMANRSVFSNDIWLDDNCGNADRTFARDVQLVGWASVGDNISTAYVVYDCAIRTKEGATIHVHKRYNAFAALDKALRRTLPPQVVHNVPCLPPKNALAKYRPAFLDSRRRKLQTWLAAVLMHPDIGGSPAHATRCGPTFRGLSAWFTEKLGNPRGWRTALVRNNIPPPHFTFSRMSMPQIPSGFSITGGIPIKSQDFAASIIFTIMYICLIPLAGFRFVKKESRSTSMIRPAIFVLVRVATYIMRAVQANGNYSETLFIVEQVFLLAGFPIICDAILTLLEYHITRTHTSPEQGKVTQRACRLLRLALLIALVLGIIAGTEIGGAINNPNKKNNLRTLRNVNAILCLALVIGVIIVVLIAQVHKSLPVVPTAVLVFMAACLIVAAAYRLASIHTTNPPIARSTKIKFYVLLALMEWVVNATLFSVNARAMFAEDLAAEKKRAAKDGNNYHAGERVPMASQQSFKDPYARA
ncbi:Proteophosphoglycan protein [Ceratobasidium theobromae]|uniref:Endosomal/vacuolar adapter protein YPT35 n=1 Tax=Ceratobasidium theobromae TaxID=1582974 RepID=A0A5N5QD36_9AGAM|nr:Proteophosphoglycan protein [Ceratobasidium theobromae]